MSDILRDDGHYQPAQLLEGRRTSAVPAKCVRPAVPVNAVVLRGDAIFRPGEVESPDAPPRVHEFVLQDRRRQPAVEHHQARFALHGRFGQWGSQAQQLTYLDDAATAGLQLDSTVELVTAARGCAARRPASPGLEAVAVHGRPRAQSTRAPW